MISRSPIAFEIVRQIALWAFWIAGCIALAGKQLQIAWLQILGVLLLVASLPFAGYFALEVRRREPTIVTPAICKIRFASSTVFLFSVVLLLFVLAVHANRSRDWMIVIVVSVVSVAKLLWDLYRRKV